MWKDWLALSKREQKGFIVLSVMLFLLIVLYLSIPLHFYPGNEVNADRELQAWIDTVKKKNIPAETQNDSLFYFDPNTAKISELEKLGIKGETLLNLLKLKESGFTFTKPEDILKVLTLDSALGVTLIKYIKTDNTLPQQTYNKKHVPAVRRTKRPISDHERIVPEESTKLLKNKRQPPIIEINSADSADFSLLKGIGPVLSARITAYRKALGGFCSAAQLKEVYGMPEETVDENLPRLTVDSTKIKTININKASMRQLKAHPYISFYAAKAIIEYRKNKLILCIKNVESNQPAKNSIYNNNPEINCNYTI
jgi:DNA uptake protein ComE-like DNA-binding protein